MGLPNRVNILGVEHKIEYVDNPAEVDIWKRSSLWGQIDHWTRTIRVYKNSRPDPDVWETVWHEILHGISNSLKIKVNGGSLHDAEEAIDLLSLAITDVLFRNGWIRETLNE